ncbi:MAG: hypothetical protein L0Y72_24055 [Gemmataceae bacterium]|nr:hypothetical protein [Gemmataceae bacterium]
MGKATVRVVDGEIEKRNGCWYVAVTPSAQPRSNYKLNGILADVELDLLEKHDLNVWLVPINPEQVGDAIS